jgi:hypothetical protein
MACLARPLRFEAAQQLGLLLRREPQPRQLALDCGVEFGSRCALKGADASC